MSEDLKKIIIEFSSFLNVSISTINRMVKTDFDDVFLQNWLQGNWELIVERLISQNKRELILLRKYGEGADETHYSLLKGQEYFERVSFPSLQPTHKIMCFSNSGPISCFFSGNKVDFPKSGLEFKELISMKKQNSYATNEAPFDKVLLAYEPIDVVLEIEKLDFKLQKLKV
ncbi:hypothetical protein [Marinicella litoralis]|uniref:Uncharacterized protein n=1 Tax=Marinicella litoralis TaxID=644220 RepID=A0A4R6XF21_9GAMM|nr:hypothetical protein [Marinicella litoralis]TDR14298.1 hypothetical protein C8D91_2961 [Marinicella litoralis]